MITPAPQSTLSDAEIDADLACSIYD